MKIVYKLCSWANTCDRGVVIKETEKQYKVKTLHSLGITGTEWTWNKSDCYESIDSAQVAITKRAEFKLERAIAEVDSLKKELEKANGWHYIEAEAVK